MSYRDGTMESHARLRQRLHDVIARLVGKPWFWMVAIGLVFLLPLGRALGRSVPKAPALKLALPDFHLVDQDGKPFGLSDLRGRVWVADFVFTSCPDVCPRLTERMGKIQHRARNLGDAFHLVTISVDPDTDTPEVLRAYIAELPHRKKHQAHPNLSRWTFLTGPLHDVEPTVIKGFKIAMGKEEVSPGTGIMSIFHGEKLVLVDAGGFIRGYYDADDEGTAALLRDAGILANVR
jgi:protein SCO1/2